MSSHQIRYLAKGPETDPKDEPVVVIGLAKNLAKLSYSDVKHKLGQSVSKEVTKQFKK